MSLYTSTGTKLHSKINKYLKRIQENVTLGRSECDGKLNPNCPIYSFIVNLLGQTNWQLIASELKLTTNNMCGIIDALFKKEINNKCEYIIVDWKFTNQIPSRNYLTKYQNLSINNLTKFNNDTHLKYILQLNLYKLLLLNAKEQDDSNSILHEHDCSWHNIKLYIIYIKCQPSGNIYSHLYECPQIDKIDLDSLVFSYMSSRRQY